MSEPFEHPKALLKRALAHLDEMDHKVGWFHAGNSHTIRTEPDPDDPSYSFLSVHFTRELPSEIFCIAFDAINCLRSVLDYAVFDATVALTGEKNPNSTKFPFGDTAENVVTQFKQGASGVPAILRQPLCEIEPFKGGKGNALWMLNKLRNSKIHRTLIPMAQNPESIGIGGNGHIESIEFFPPIRRLDNSDIIMLRMKGTAPGIKFDFGFGVGFQHDAVSITNASEFLRDVAKAIEEIVSSLAIEASTRT